MTSGSTHFRFGPASGLPAGLTGARLNPALLIRGKLERYEGVVSVVAARIEPLTVPTGAPKSRDFR